MDHSHHDHHADHSNHGNDPGYTVVPDNSLHHENHDHEGHHGHGHAHHQAFFNTQLNVTVLFENWQLNSRTHMFWACLVTALLCVGYQGTKWLRTYLHANFKDKRHTIKSKEHFVQTFLHTIKSKEHFVQTFLYGIEFIISYILMLIVMTYNVWILIVTIVAIGIGYFLFGWHRYVKDSCAETCTNIVERRNLEYDRNPSSQELVPLGNEQGFDDTNVDRETDIVT